MKLRRTEAAGEKGGETNSRCAAQQAARDTHPEAAALVAAVMVAAVAMVMVAAVMVAAVMAVVVAS